MNAFVFGSVLLAAGPFATSAAAYVQVAEQSAAQRMGAFSVRLDAVRLDAEGRVDTRLTLRNDSGEAQQLTDATLTVVLQDTDGLGVAITELHDGSQTIPLRFATPPTVAPGAELNVRYLLRPLANGAPVTRVIVREADGASAAFDIAHLATSAMRARPAGPTGTGSFAPLGLFAVRRDDLRVTAGRLELFFTVRNTSKQAQQISGEFEFLLGGGTANRREFGPARGSFIAAHDTLVVEAGGEARLRTWFEARGPGPLRVTDWTITAPLD